MPSIYNIYIICSVPSISELLRGKIGRVHHATQSFDYAECTPCIELYIVVLVQVLQLVIVDVLLPNPGPGAVVEACFAMNLHKAVDVLCLHRMRFIGRQHLLHFVVFFFFCTRCCSSRLSLAFSQNNAYCSCEDLLMTLDGGVTAELHTGVCAVLHQ